MPMHRVAPLVALLLVLFAGPAWAFLDPPTLHRRIQESAKRFPLTFMEGSAICSTLE